MLSVPIHVARTNASRAIANAFASVKWHSTDWQKVAFIVGSLQPYIVKVVWTIDESIATAAWTKAFRVLERYALKNACPVLRGEGGSNAPDPPELIKL